MKYAGAQCPVCNQVFAEGDDIVVCPVCGGPHHRECYAKLGHCALLEQHEQGIEWEQPALEEEAQDAATVACHRCGAQNPADGLFCQVCGVKLSLGQQQGGGGNPYQSYGSQYGNPYNSTQGGQTNFEGAAFNPYAFRLDPYGGVDPELELAQGVKVKEVAAFVGPSSSIYVPRFAVLSRNPGALTWNWSSFIFNFLYFFYRKMYKVALPLLVLFACSMLPAFAYSYEYLGQMLQQYGRFVMPLPQITNETLERLALLSNLARAAHLGVSGVVALFANRIYLNHSIAAVRKAQSSGNVQTEQYIASLRRTGGASTGMVWLVVLALAALYVGACFLISFLLIYHY